MKFSKSLKLSINMILHSKLRSWLTIIGIVIGIASVISIVGIGEGMNNQIQADLGVLNADIITITPGFSKAAPGSFGGRNQQTTTTQISDITITNKDLLVLKTISNIQAINTKISSNAKVDYMGKTGTLTITGIEPNAYNLITTTSLLNGRTLGPSDSNTILISKNLAKEYFEKEIQLNQPINIESKTFRVIGILDDNSNSIIMNINAAYDILEDKEKGVYDSLEVKIKNADILNETETQIIEQLMKSRNVNEKTQDFTVRTNVQANTTRQEMISTLTLFLTAIASISLLVGAVGIANTMFTAVLEKTKEIGIMKAIGARNIDIMLLFLLNSAIIGLIGGVLGISLGYIISKLLTDSGMIVIIEIKMVLITIIISILVGITSGLIPAYNASKLDPVEALRRE